MPVVRTVPFHYYIYGNDALFEYWSHVFGSNDWIGEHWTIKSLPFYGQNNAAYVDMSLNVQYVDSRDNDRLTLTDPIGQGANYVLNIKGVEHIDAPTTDVVHLEIVGKVGFTTDGSLDSLRMNVGHHTMVYTGATRDQTLFMGSGWDTVQLVDQPDISNAQYWSVIRRVDGEVDAYSLYSGNRVRMQEGSVTWGNTNGRVNYGEVDEIQLASRIRGSGDVHLPGIDLSDAEDRGSFDNIDLSETGTRDFTDRFNAASFKSINYATTNVHKGTAVIEAFAGDTVSGTQSSIKDHITTNGIHDLIVEQQAAALDGHLRLYVRDNNSGLYNRFNEVFLGASGADSNANTYSTTSKNAYAIDAANGGGADNVFGTAMYGFDGNDILSAGADVDYLFGGTSTYSTITTANNQGNQLTGGDGSDYFGVGNISAGADGDAIMSTNFTARLSGSSPSSSSDTGRLSRVDLSDTSDLATRVATDRITDWTSGVDHLRVLANGTAIIEGLGTANGAGGGYFADPIGGDAETIDLSGSRVNNEGKIVARGLGGSDTLIGSTGDDWLYGNASTNFYSIGQGGNDRVYVDQFDGSRSRHFVEGFTTSDGAASNTDLFMLNKKIIDAFYSGGAGRAALKLDVDANYTQGQAKSAGVNYLYNNFYSGSYASSNETHNNADGGGFWEGGSGADGTSSFIGLGMAIAGRGMFAIPFVGPIIGAVMIAASIPIEGLGFDPSPTREHRNAEYDGVVNAYLNVIADSYGGNGVSLNTTVGVDNSGLRFLDFFQGSDAGDGYLPVVEFTAHSGQGIYGYFALHSDDETFVYLVASSDNMVENAEAIFVAEINGRLSASDFGIYNGEDDVYNYGIVPTVVIRTPTVTKVADSASPTADEAQVDGILADVQNPIVISGTVSGALAPGSYFRVYDGPSKIYDGDSAVAVPQVTLSQSGTNFTFTDSRALGTTVKNTTNTGTNDTFVLSDAYVRYTVELVDGETGIPTRVSVKDIKVSGGNAVIDGSTGSDILLVTETSVFLNNISDARLIGMETIVLAGAVTVVGGVDTPTPINLSLANQSEGFEVISGDAGDTIVGSSGNDTIFGVGGADSIDAASGADVVVYSTSYEVITTLVGEVETNTTTDTIVSTASQNLAADLTVDGGDGVDTLRFDTDRYDGSTLMFSAPVALTDAQFAKVIRFENLALNGTGTQAVTLAANANTAFANGITVTTAPTATSLNFDASNANWTRTTHVTGTNNADTMTGGSGNDTLIGGSGNDTITAGTGNDNLSGDDDADTFVLASNLTSADTISGGDGGTNSDTLTFTDANGAADDLNNVTGIETITLGNTTTNVVVTTIDALVASGATLTVNGSSLTSGTMTWNGAAETDGKFHITGGAGNDTITGGAGNDTLLGGLGSDIIIAGAGNDSLLGGRDDDTFILAGNLTSADTISGADTGTNNDTLTFTDANGAADDLNNVTGIETIILGNTTTNVVVTTVDALVASGATLTVNGSSLTTGTMTWNATAETNGKFSITGGDAADTIIAGSGNDTILGGTGNDIITGRGGIDSLDGGAGNDVFLFASASELADDVTVIGGSETDTIRMDTGSTALTLADSDFADVIQVENLDLTGTAAQTVTLGAQTNEAFASGITITTNATAASLNLQGSASSVSINATGTNNADTLVGGSAADTLDAGSGGGSIDGGGGNDRIVWFGTGNTTISGGDGDDLIDSDDGQTGADRISGDAGNDTIYGRGGDDTILGGTGDDYLIGESGSDVLWGGQGADTISSNDGSVDSIIMVGDLSTADSTKLADVNATLDTLMGYDYPNVDNSYESDVNPGDVLTFDTSVTDVLYTFGTVDLSGLSISGNYSIVAHSKITLTESQLNAATSITFVGASSHEIVVVNNDRSAIDGMDQQVIIESWADQAGQQLNFVKGNAAATATGMSVGGNNYVAVPTPASPMLTDEKFETPVRSGVAAGSPFATSAGVQNLRWDNANGGGTLANFAVSGDEFITSPGFRVSNRVEINDRFAGANFVTYFEPGYTQLPIPSTFGSYGDDAVHREQFEVFNGSYDIRTGIFTVQRSPYFGESTRAEYTLIIYDDDPETTVGDVEGIVFANQLLERSGWSTVSPRTADAKLQYGNTALDNSGSYNYIYGTSGNDGALTSTGAIDYIYALDGNDYLIGGTNDFLFAGTGSDTVVSGTGENLIDLGYTLATWSTGDDAQDIVTVGAGTSQLAGANAYSYLTGQDYIYNFEFDLDILRVVKTGVSNFSHALNTTLGGASTTSGQTAAAFSGTTLTVDLDANGTLGSGDVVVTFDQYHATIGTSRVQYDLDGTSGNDFIVGGDLADTIEGLGGDDLLNGGAGADSILAGDGNDTVVGAQDDLKLDGGNQTDTLQIASNFNDVSNDQIVNFENVTLTSGGLTVTLTDQTENLNITGFATGGSTITAGSGNDTISGGTGNDRLTGGTGTDSLFGGNGNDVFIVNGTADISAGEVYNGGADLDTLSVTATTDFTGVASITLIETISLAAGVSATFDAADLSGQTLAIDGTGNNGGESLTFNGTSAGEVINLGGLTVDVDDIAGAVINAAEGNDSVTGTNGADTITGGAGNDSLLGGTGNDVFIVNGTADISAGEVYNGGDGVDTLSVTATTDFTGVASITLIETISLAAGVSATFDAADLSGQTLAIDGTGNNGGESLTFNGTSAGEVINLGGLTVDVDDIAGAVINAGEGDDTITGTNGADTITGGAGADVFKYTDTGDTTTTNTISRMDVIEGFSITEDSFDLSSLGTVSGLTATVDPSDTDSYVISWTSGGVTNYVYVKDTGVTGGLTLTDNGSGSVTATATAAPALAISLISVSSTGITTQGDGPHRAYFTKGDTAPIRNDSTTYFTQSTNVGASTNYTFALADIDAADSVVRVGHIAIQETNTGVNTYLDARIYIGGATDTNDTIVADISGGRTTLNYSIIYAQGGNDTITGSTGNDYIFGGAGNDSIAGSDGADSIFGGAGSDTMTGGAGSDIFVFSSAATNGSDTITDFSQASDKFDFSSVGPIVFVRNPDWYIVSNETANTSASGKVTVLISALGDSSSEFDTAAEMAAQFDVGRALDLERGGSAIVIAGEDVSSGSFPNVYIWHVQDQNNDRIVQEGELTLLATVNGFGVTTLTDSNFIL